MRKITIKQAERAFNTVRNELYELGLLSDGSPLDQVDLVLDWLPSFSTLGYVIEEKTSWWEETLGFENGIIYIPQYAPHYSLTDIIRHEFGHAWYYTDKKFFRRPWFKETFGAAYGKEAVLGGEHLFEAFEKVSGSFESSPYYDEYDNSYCLVDSAEDFCETFMTYLRKGEKVDQFKSRKSLFIKINSLKKQIRNYSNR